MPTETSPAGTPPDEGAVPTPDSSADRERFVVGVDGSGQSTDALRWAVRIAGDTTEIEVLTAWEPGPGVSGPFIATAGGVNVGPEQDAQALLSNAVRAAYGHNRPPNLTMRAVRGDAAHVLIEESKTAQLLVIGSRGLGEVAGLLLGSVSARCAEKAECPVLVLHTPEPS